MAAGDVARLYHRLSSYVYDPARPYDPLPVDDPWVVQGFVPGPDGDRAVYLSGIALAEVKDELLRAFRDTAGSLRWRDVPLTPVPTRSP